MSDPVSSDPVSSDRVSSEQRAAEPITTLGGLLVIVFRAFGGFAIMLLCLLEIARRPDWEISAVDAVYAATTISLVGLQLHAARGRTTVRKSLLGVLPLLFVAAIIWIVTHSFHWR